MNQKSDAVGNGRNDLSVPPCGTPTACLRCGTRPSATRVPEEQMNFNLLLNFVLLCGSRTKDG